MDDPFYLKKILGMRGRLNPFTKKPSVQHFRLTTEHKRRLYAISSETGLSIDEVLSVIFDLGLVCEKDKKGRTDKVYFDPDMDCNDYYHALLIKGIAAYDAGKR